MLARTDDPFDFSEITGDAMRVAQPSFPGLPQCVRRQRIWRQMIQNAAWRAGAAFILMSVLALMSGCGTSDSQNSAGPLGCDLTPAATLQKALGSDHLRSTGTATIAKPDPETGLVTCDTQRTDRTGYTVHVQVQKATAADLRARANWESSKPTASAGCKQPAFVKDENLAGVSCIETASEGQSTRVYVVSDDYTIITELSLASSAKPADSAIAFKIAQSTNTHIG